MRALSMTIAAAAAIAANVAAASSPAQAQYAKIWSDAPIVFECKDMAERYRRDQASSASRYFNHGDVCRYTDAHGCLIAVHYPRGVDPWLETEICPVGVTAVHETQEAPS